jgi:hypothetical protein
MLDAAIQGRDVPALRLLYERLEGKVPDRIERLNGLTPQELAMVEQMRAFREAAGHVGRGAP